MKNLGLLPAGIRGAVSNFIWNCGCGQEGLRVSVTKKGSVQGHCFRCGLTIFWNDTQLFGFENAEFGYVEEKIEAKRTKKGDWTWWYPLHRVRVFRRQ